MSVFVSESNRPQISPAGVDPGGDMKIIPTGITASGAAALVDLIHCTNMTQI